MPGIMLQSKSFVKKTKKGKVLKVRHSHRQFHFMTRCPHEAGTSSATSLRSCFHVLRIPSRSYWTCWESSCHQAAMVWPSCRAGLLVKPSSYCPQSVQLCKHMHRW